MRKWETLNKRPIGVSDIGLESAGKGQHGDVGLVMFGSGFRVPKKYVVGGSGALRGCGVVWRRQGSLFGG